MIYPGDLVQLVSPKGKRYLRVAGADSELHTHDGKLDLKSICDLDYGQCIRTHLDKEYRLFKPTLFELLKKIDRQTQIIYPKDAGYILLQLGVLPGKRIGEAGTGSGGLTMLLANAVGADGHVYTYEKNANLTKVIQKNLVYENASANVTCYPQSLEQGLHESDLDAFFLDIREPGDALGPIHESLKPAGHLGILVPTVNQVMKVLQYMRSHPFLITEVSEIMLRSYKLNASRLRPQDRMVGHTGYLIFARALQPGTRGMAE